MIKSLRKRHLQVWYALMVLLPVGILFAWLAIPHQHPVKLLQASNTNVLPVIEKTVELPGYTIHLRADELRSSRQLEWINKLVLKVPSAVIYQVSDTAFDISTSKLLGRIETSGTYLFPLDSAAVAPRLVLYDFIHQQVIDHINFTP